MKRESIVCGDALADPDRMSSDLANEPLFVSPRGDDDARGDRPVLRELLSSFERNIIVTALFAAGPLKPILKASWRAWKGCMPTAGSITTL